MGAQKWHFLILTSLLLSFPSTSPSSIGSPVHHERRREAIEVEGGPGSVVWVVQLSDLHFSVFHPDRASDFRRYVGPALSIIKPSLVLITGDLTDGKSKDLLTMKQEEREWIEYENATRVIMTSGLDERIFYDLRGNHDSFGVPVQGGTNDFYEKYSINARLRRNGNVQSVTLKTRDGKHLFVGIDSTLATAGLRGPTNLFGHPTDQLLETIDKALSEWDNSNQFVTSQVTKVVFGHFPLSFTALTETQRNLKEVFLKHSISAYLCGHLHARFGRNLKRHHLKSQNEYFQYNMHESTREVYINETEGCQKKKKEIKEFWEWEMGDWRKRRSFRILAIDSGDVSFVDVDFKYGSRDIIIVPTFPLDSRIMQRISSTNDFKCQNKETRKYETIRALVFSKHQVASVAVKVYDYRSGTLNLVLDSEMKKMEAKENKRGELYFVPWNWRAFVDTSPDRYWIKIEATDMTGDTVSSPLKPFSINGLSSTMSWSWTEFMVMGCQWAVIYWPALWFIFAIAFLFLLVQKIALAVWKNHNIRGKNFREYLISSLVCLFTELPRISTIWTILFGYLVYLLLLPWLFGYAITEEGNLMYMTYRGWSDATLNGVSEGTGVGFPDVMVIALPHLVWVVLPAILVMASLAAERSVYRIVFLSLTGKKEDDNGRERNSGGIKGHLWSGRWIRKFLLVASIAIVWKHWKQCRALVKAYEINPFIHAPVYCFFIPALLAFCIYKTSSI